MECPKCHGLSVIIKDGTKYCQATGCTYMSFHVITYQNQIRQFQGQKGAESRFSFSAGPNKEKQTKLQKNFSTSSKVIRDLANAMKLSIDIIDKAEAKLVQILRLKYPEKDKEQQEEEGQKTKSKDKDKINISNAKIAAYCLYAACFDKKMYFKDVRIANQMGMSKEQWASMIKELNIKLKDYMNTPHLNLEHYVMRICKKRAINKVEENAMLEMVQRVKQFEIIGGNRPNTIAACIFWQIMIRSRYYVERGFDMKDYLKSRQKQDESETGYWRQRHFQVSFDVIKKFKNEHFHNKLSKLIPQFEGRIPEQQLKNKNN